MPKLRELAQRHEDQGLVLIGVHTTRGGEQMADYVAESGIDYPVALDIESRTTSAYAVDSYPDYYLIDRAGNLRVADLSNGDLERAIEVLLAEPAPIAPELAQASEVAQFKDKRILLSWGSASEQQALDQLLRADRALGKLAFNEYERVPLEREGAAELAAALGLGGSGAALSALDAQGRLLAHFDARALEAGGLREFLQTHRVPQLDARSLWREALAQAEREQKRLLVHLGAPW